MQKIVVAIDSFKGSLTSTEAGLAVEVGIRSVDPNCEVIRIPIADGGEGWLESLLPLVSARYVSLEAHDATLHLRKVRYGISNDCQTAFIEMAAINGLALLPPEERNPLNTSSYGTGELIRDALQKGCKNFVIGLGGSATNDGGLGMLQALGFRILDKKGQTLGQGGKIMAQVAYIDATAVHPGLSEAHFTVACDVENPFYGPEGAAYVYARQKGADQKMIQQLDKGMQNLAQVITATIGRDISAYPGAGAAGGLGGCFMAFFNARLQSGIRLLLETVAFQQKIQGADYIITGEGRADRQTLCGKVAWGVLEEARQQHIPVILLAGSLDDLSNLQQAGFQAIFSITPGPLSLEQAMHPDFAKAHLQFVASQICSLLSVHRS